MSVYVANIKFMNTLAKEILPKVVGIFFERLDILLPSPRNFVRNFLRLATSKTQLISAKGIRHEKIFPPLHRYPRIRNCQHINKLRRDAIRLHRSRYGRTRRGAQEYLQQEIACALLRRQ